MIDIVECFLVICMNFIVIFKINANFEINFYKKHIVFRKKFGDIKLKMYFCNKIILVFAKSKNMAIKI